MIQGVKFEWLAKLAFFKYNAQFFIVYLNYAYSINIL